LLGGVKMKYRVINYIKRLNWEGAIIEDIDTKKKYITNGVYKWEARENRVEKCTTVESIDKDKFLEYWNRNQGINQIIEML